MEELNKTIQFIAKIRTILVWLILLSLIGGITMFPPLFTVGKNIMYGYFISWFTSIIVTGKASMNLIRNIHNSRMVTRYLNDFHLYLKENEIEFSDAYRYFLIVGFWFTLPVGIIVYNIVLRDSTMFNKTIFKVERVKESDKNSFIELGRLQELQNLLDICKTATNVNTLEIILKHRKNLILTSYKTQQQLKKLGDS